MLLGEGSVGTGSLEDTGGCVLRTAAAVCGRGCVLRALRSDCVCGERHSRQCLKNTVSQRFITLETVFVGPCERLGDGRHGMWSRVPELELCVANVLLRCC